MESISSLIIINLVMLFAMNSKNTTMNRSINEKAPVVEKQQIFIPASPQRVWEVLSGIDNWPEWQSEVTQAEMPGELKEGTVFKWKAGGISFTSKLHTVIDSQAIGWTGKTIGAKAIHNWYFEASEEGTTVYVEESLEGFFPNLFKKKFSKSLHEGMTKNLNELSAACLSKTTSNN